MSQIIVVRQPVFLKLTIALLKLFQAKQDNSPPPSSQQFQLFSELIRKKIACNFIMPKIKHLNFKALKLKRKVVNSKNQVYFDFQFNNKLIDPSKNKIWVTFIQVYITPLPSPYKIN